MTAVVHVAESFASGVSSAISSYVASTPDLHHHLIYATRDEAPVSADAFDIFESTHPLPEGHLRRVAAVEQVVRSLDVDVMHLHSTYAGVYGRLARRSARQVRVVYTPHCFAFERASQPRIVNVGIRCLEKALSRRTTTFAACSDHEALLARKLGFRGEVHVVPNLLPPTPDQPVSPCSRPLVVTVGRASSQKDPGLFAAIAQRARALVQEMDFEWIGDGDQAVREMLHASGVHVTGWLSPTEVQARLRGADAYVHTASWEGFPVVILEALSAGLPTVVARRPYTLGSPDELLFADADEAVSLLTRLRSESDRRANFSRWLDSLRENTRETQSDRLRLAYGSSRRDTSCS